GMLRKVGGGLYTFMPLGMRALRKVEQIIREEMDRAGAQEILMPALQPAELWRTTGRWESMGAGMFKVTDRKEAKYALAPTAEEVVTALLKGEVSSYRQLPKTVYQIQTKFRDEIRPRFGLMRGKEFIMKDAYSFDTTMDAADKSYQAMFDAYVRIFKRCGLAAKPVEADTGDIGGSSSHEFMVLAPSGEDSILDCAACGYAANQERAERQSMPVPYQQEVAAAEVVDTPGQETCVAVAAFLNVAVNQIVKSLVVLANGQPVMVLVPGDCELNELKLKRILGGAKISEASAEAVAAAVGPVGSIGPVGVTIPVYADRSLEGAADVVTGANQAGKHLLHVSLARDAHVLAYEDLVVVSEGDHCPRCGKPLAVRRGIEVGHVFKLGMKYTQAFNATYLDEAGAAQTMVMGCYGIGVTRTLQAIVEQSNDANGIVWPAAIAPYQVNLLILDPDNRDVVARAEALGSELEALGVDVFVDDRAERPGIKFKDADLIGLPVRVVAGAKSFEKGGFEVRRRTDADAVIRSPETAAAAIVNLLK
ncbi:MAG: proline--tRNA ligase, partial [Kiritimatiellia bacterium]